jgi:hypothetical protein
MSAVSISRMRQCGSGETGSKEFCRSARLHSQHLQPGSCPHQPSEFQGPCTAALTAWRQLFADEGDACACLAAMLSPSMNQLALSASRKMRMTSFALQPQTSITASVILRASSSFCWRLRPARRSMVTIGMVPPGFPRRKEWLNPGFGPVCVGRSRRQQGPR